MRSNSNEHLPKLTPEQSEIITTIGEFSVHIPMKNVILAFPSVTFEKKGSNGGVTDEWKLTGPRVWVQKILKNHSYGPVRDNWSEL